LEAFSVNKKKRILALCGGICGIVYLINQVHPLPDFLRCFAMGLVMGFMLLVLIPDEWAGKLKRWKCGG